MLDQEGKEVPGNKGYKYVINFIVFFLDFVTYVENALKLGVANIVRCLQCCWFYDDAKAVLVFKNEYLQLCLLVFFWNSHYVTQYVIEIAFLELIWNISLIAHYWYYYIYYFYHRCFVRYFGAAKDLPGVRELFEQERECFSDDHLMSRFLYDASSLQQIKMRIIWWMCRLKVTDRFMSNELRKRGRLRGYSIKQIWIRTA